MRKVETRLVKNLRGKKVQDELDIEISDINSDELIDSDENNEVETCVGSRMDKRSLRCQFASIFGTQWIYTFIFIGHQVI